MAFSDIIDLVSVEYLLPMISAFIVGLVFTSVIVKPIQIAFGLLSVLFLVFGFNSYNAIYDKKIDTINKPTRPLPNGRLSDKQAFNLTAVFLILSLLFALGINYIFLFIDLFGVILALLYSHPYTYLKKHFFINTMIGNLTFAVIYPLEGWALNYKYPIPWHIIVLLLFIGFGTASLKDFEDVDGDKSHNIKTIPVVLNHSRAAKLISAIFLSSLIIISALILKGILSVNYVLIGVLIIIAAANAYLLSRNKNKHASKNAFIYGVLILTAINICLIVLKLL